MVIAFCLYAFMVPMFFWVGRDLRNMQEFFFQMAGTILVTFNFLIFNNRSKFKVNVISIIIFSFLVYNIIQFTLCGMRIGSTIILNLLIASIIYYIMTSINKEYTRKILDMIIAVCAINFVYIFLQKIHFDFIYVVRGPNGTTLPDVFEPIGFLGLSSWTGMFMGIGMIASCIISPFMSICFLPMLYLSKSMGAIAGTFSGMLFYLFWMKRKAFYVILPAMVVAASCYFVLVDNPMGMTGTRPPMWKMALKDTIYGLNLHNPQFQSPFLRNPVLGFGVDSWGKGIVKYFKEVDGNTTIRGFNGLNGLVDNENRPFKRSNDGYILSPAGKRLDYWDNPHCLPVQIFYEYGFIGWAMLVMLIYFMMKRFVSSVKSHELIIISSILICIFISSLTQFPIWTARIGYLVPIMLGLFVLYTEPEQEQDNSLRYGRVFQ